VLIIGPGFGLQINPQQAGLIKQGGFQVHWCLKVPNPESPNFNATPYLDQLKADIDHFNPHLVACASKGGVYVVGLWQKRYWLGPTLLINTHPSCKSLPSGVPIVLCQGSNDETYPTPRAKAEQVISTASRDKAYLYYTADSGKLPSGHLTRKGDRHNMESLLKYDCLNRLIDAALCEQGPEMHVMRTWRERLSEDRLQSETWLGYTQERLRKRWTLISSSGSDGRGLVEVKQGSDEFRNISVVFRSAPREAPAYLLAPQADWERRQILKVERVENAPQASGCVKPYFDLVRKSLADQGVPFEPGTHTCWAFHGADASAIESILNDPVAGFQPLATGKNTHVWGAGTYFARDAKYVADGGFCGAPAKDGSKQMLMCLLSIGTPCLGDPKHNGVLPYRQQPHRYTCSVDSLSNPEVYIVQHPGAAMPAYLITFK
jgi:hypothetical protein